MIGRAFADHPRRHAPLILDDRGLERIDQPPAQIASEVEEQLLIDQIALGSVRQQVPAAVGSAASGSPCRCQTRVGRRGGLPASAPATSRAPCAAKCSSSLAKCRTALLSTTSANASGNVMCSTGSLRKLFSGRARRKLRGRWREPRQSHEDLRPRRRCHSRSGRSRRGSGRRRSPASTIAHARRDAPAKELIEEVDVDLAELRFRDQACASVWPGLNPAHPRKRISVASGLRLVAPRNLGRFGRGRRSLPRYALKQNAHS